MQQMFTWSCPQTFTWTVCRLLPACVSSALVTAHQYDHCDHQSIAIFGRSISFIAWHSFSWHCGSRQYYFSNKGMAISCSRPSWEIAYFKCTRLDLFSKIAFVQFCLIYGVYAVIGSLLPWHLRQYQAANSKILKHLIFWFYDHFVLFL